MTRAEGGTRQGGTLTLYDELVAWQKVLDALARESWAIFRRDDANRWQIIESGEAPPAWRKLSSQNGLFAIRHQRPLRTGDRIAIGEEAWEVQEDRSFSKVDGKGECGGCGAVGRDPHHEECPF